MNYIEGQVTLDGQSVGAQAMGSTEVQPGQMLETGQGKVEMLLTPGVFLRLADQSGVRMVSPSLIDTRVELIRGEAMVEADQVLPGNHLVISDHGTDVQIQKNGVYKFTAEPAMVAVYDGKAEVFRDDRTTEIGKGKELTLAAATGQKPGNFDRNNVDSLYQWSDVRSEYLAEANQSSVQTIVTGNPGWWYGTGWYWNPWFSSWAFVPGNGFFYSPFGFGFYSPAYWNYYPPVRYFVRPGVLASTARVASSASRASMSTASAMRATVGGGMRMGGFGGRR
ncbi:MAG: hypothetical protein ABSF62_10780 [Bryobacteraceae bacterium]